jgi:hypothetical protein
LEQVQDILRRLNEYRKKSASSQGDTDVNIKEYSFKVGQKNGESVVNIKVDLSLTPKSHKQNKENTHKPP